MPSLLKSSALFLPIPFNLSIEILYREAIIPPNGTVTPENRREMPLESSQNTPKEIVKQEIRYIEKPSRKITEIRIFFDDNTYETFRGEK